MIKKIGIKQNCFFMYSNYLLSFILFISLWSCKSNDNNAQKFIDSIQPKIVSLGVDFKSDFNVFILTDNGCPACNHKYLDFIVDHVINKANTVIYSTASGTNLDISPLLSDTINNLIRGDHDLIFRAKLDEHSYWVHIENQKVDTIVALKAEGLDQTLDFLLEMQTKVR